MHELLTAQTVRAKVAVGSWEEATEAVGGLLVEAGQVEPGYVQAMKRVFAELGPYAVIAPGIALLHARPTDGVLQPCLGLITLAQPRDFGNRDNDPVDIVFAFGAVDKTAHIRALQELSQLLMRQEVLQQMRAAADDCALLAAMGAKAGAGVKEG